MLTQRRKRKIDCSKKVATFWFFCNRHFKQKKSALPKLGIAPRLPRPQRGVLLLDYFGATAYGGSGYRSRFSTLRRLYATMYNNPPCASIGTRTRILSLEGINTTLVLWTLGLCERSAHSARGQPKKKKIREGRFELPTKGSLRTQMHTLQSSALPLSYPRCAPCIPPV